MSAQISAGALGGQVPTTPLQAFRSGVPRRGWTGSSADFRPATIGNGGVACSVGKPTSRPPANEAAQVLLTSSRARRQFPVRLESPVSLLMALKRPARPRTGLPALPARPEFQQ